MVADLASELALCENWLWHVADLIHSGCSDFSIEASIAKQRASDLAMRMTTDAVQLFGGYGYCRDCCVERLMRDAKITQIWEGTNQIHYQLIGRSFIERWPEPCDPGGKIRSALMVAAGSSAAPSSMRYGRRRVCEPVLLEQLT